MKVFISMPMRGRPVDEIRAEQTVALNLCQRMYPSVDLEILDQVEKPEGMTRAEMILDSMNIMRGADIIYFAKDWENAPGCRMEHMYAKEYLNDKVILD